MKVVQTQWFPACYTLFDEEKRLICAACRGEGIGSRGVYCDYCYFWVHQGCSFVPRLSAPRHFLCHPCFEGDD